ncbi:MAG: hypothetical protein HY816_02295 [Candidatus Wallbacteria bacterium]|nr:hypothetical protein [Candidatus Wallbacteria bacterium]
MNAALTIARFTLKKALRERLYVVFFIVTAVLVGAGGSVSFFETGVQVKFLKDVSMFVLATFGFLLALFAASDLLPHELETRGIQFIVSKPAGWREVVAGKYLALVALLVGNLAPLIAEMFALVWLYSGRPHLDLLAGAGLVVVEMAVYGALVMLLSVLASRLVTLFGALLVYVVAHLSDWVTGTFLASSPGWLRACAGALLALLPDLSHFDSRFVVVHQYAVPAEFLGLLLVYGAVYTAAALLASCLVLESREL